MPILRPTGIEGIVQSVLVNAKPDQGLATRKIGSANVTYEGLEGDWHSTLVREACVRTKRQYPEGTEIRNTRQISIISVEDMEEIARKTGLPHIKPEWLGANILLSGIPNFTLVPPGSRLIFSDGASLVVDMENEPCKFPGDVIDQHHSGYGRLFAPSARNLRGVTAWVEKQGAIGEGNTIALHIPPQRIYEIP
jgi:hypothetical protein